MFSFDFEIIVTGKVDINNTVVTHARSDCFNGEPFEYDDEHVWEIAERISLEMLKGNQLNEIKGFECQNNVDVSFKIKKYEVESVTETIRR